MAKENDHETDATEGKVQVENPPPCCILCEEAPKKRPNQRANRPGELNEVAILGSFSKRNNVRNNDDTH